MSCVSQGGKKYSMSLCRRPIGCKLPGMRACSYSRDRACDSDRARSVVHAHRDRKIAKSSRNRRSRWSTVRRGGERLRSTGNSILVLAAAPVAIGFHHDLAPTKILRRCRCTRPDEILIDMKIFYISDTVCPIQLIREFAKEKLIS